MRTSFARHFVLSIVFFLSTYSTSVSCNEFSPYFSFDSFTYSETVSISDSLNNWEGDTFNKGKRQWTWNRVEAGIQYNHWSIGYLYRVDYDLRFTEDLSELYWLTENREDLPTGKTFDIALSANAFKARGYRFAYRNTLANNISFSVGLSYLSAYYMIEGDIWGDATALAENDYEFNLDLDYQYTEDTLFDREVEKPKGEGLTLDASIAFHPSPKDHVQIQVSDLYGVISWKDAPFTVGASTSDRKHFDENGYAVIDPLISGREGIIKTFKQRLDPRWFLGYQHDLTERVGVQLKARHQYGHALHAIGATYSKLGAWAVDYWVENKLIELSWARGSLRTSIGLDNLKKNQAKQFWVSFAYKVGQ